MKYVKTLGLGAVVAAALMAFIGSGTASATIFCKEGKGEVCPSGKGYPEKTAIEATLVTGTKSKLVTSFKTIECEVSTFKAETLTEEAEPLSGPEGSFSLSKCNCEVKVLKSGLIGTVWISGTNNGTETFSAGETTVLCNTIFGIVHCIYATEFTDVGTLIGSSPAKLKVEATIPRLATNGLCSEKSEWSAEYEITAPNPLFVGKRT